MDLLSFIDRFQERVFKVHQDIARKRELAPKAKGELQTYLQTTCSSYSYSMVERELIEAANYQSIIFESSWEVTRKTIAREQQKPKVVILSNSDSYLCSCLQFNRTGIPCRHILSLFIHGDNSITRESPSTQDG